VAPEEEEGMKREVFMGAEPIIVGSGAGTDHDDPSRDKMQK
jgi:hypothetical protein